MEKMLPPAWPVGKFVVQFFVCLFVVFFFFFPVLSFLRQGLYVALAILYLLSRPGWPSNHGSICSPKAETEGTHHQTQLNVEHFLSDGCGSAQTIMGGVITPPGLVVLDAVRKTG